MRHVLAPRPVAPCPLGMCKASPAAVLVAPPRITLGTSAGAAGAIIGAVDLAAVATTADQRLAAAAHAHEQPGRRGAALTGPADFPWTSATIGGILAPHACPARVWGTASSVTAKFRSAPCLPLYPGKPLPRLRRLVSTRAPSTHGATQTPTQCRGRLNPAGDRQNCTFAGFARIQAAIDSG